MDGWVVAQRGWAGLARVWFRWDGDSMLPGRLLITAPGPAGALNVAACWAEFEEHEG